jgi:hypothetical protein
MVYCVPFARLRLALIVAAAATTIVIGDSRRNPLVAVQFRGGRGSRRRRRGIKPIDAHQCAESRRQDQALGLQDVRKHDRFHFGRESLVKSEQQSAVLAFALGCGSWPRSSFDPAGLHPSRPLIGPARRVVTAKAPIFFCRDALRTAGGHVRSIFCPRTFCPDSLASLARCIISSHGVWDRA